MFYSGANTTTEPVVSCHLLSHIYSTPITCIYWCTVYMYVLMYSPQATYKLENGNEQYMHTRLHSCICMYVCIIYTHTRSILTYICAGRAPQGGGCCHEGFDGTRHKLFNFKCGRDKQIRPASGYAVVEQASEGKLCMRVCA